MKIKKLKCSPSLIYIIIGMFLVLASLDFLDIDHYNRSGIHKANYESGLFALMIALLTFVFSKHFCVLKEETVYKCISCGSVFVDNYRNNFTCQNCGDGLITIEDYYSNEEVETQVYVPLLNEDMDVWKPLNALHQKENIYKIVSENSSPTDELWQYNLNDLVKCKTKKFEDGKVGLVAYEQLCNKSDELIKNPKVDS